MYCYLLQKDRCKRHSTQATLNKKIIARESHSRLTLFVKMHKTSHLGKLAIVSTTDSARDREDSNDLRTKTCERAHSCIPWLRLLQKKGEWLTSHSLRVHWVSQMIHTRSFLSSFQWTKEKAQPRLWRGRDHTSASCRHDDHNQSSDQPQAQ